MPGLSKCRVKGCHQAGWHLCNVEPFTSFLRWNSAGYVNGIADDKFVPSKEDPGFALVGGVKDVGHMQRLSADSGAPLPIADIIMQHLEQVSVRLPAAQPCYALHPHRASQAAAVPSATPDTTMQHPKQVRALVAGNMAGTVSVHVHGSGEANSSGLRARHIQLQQPILHS